MTEPRRERLVDGLRARGEAHSDRVVRALLHVPREAFLPPELAGDAHEDRPLPIGGGQTISAPHMVARMAEALDVRPGHRVLEVGGGSGYHAAILGHLAAPDGHVWCVERLPDLAERARASLAAAGLAHAVTVNVGDGAEGLPALAPFDRISVACAAPAVPPPLLDQLARNGRMIIPVGGVDLQDLQAVDKLADGRLVVHHLGGVRFVPLVGPHGFPG